MSAKGYRNEGTDSTSNSIKARKQYNVWDIVSYPSVAARTIMTRITARMTSRQQALFRAFFW